MLVLNRVSNRVTWYLHHNTLSDLHSNIFDRWFLDKADSRHYNTLCSSTQPVTSHKRSEVLQNFHPIVPFAWPDRFIMNT
jgi:hypothetical protein